MKIIGKSTREKRATSKEKEGQQCESEVSPSVVKVLSMERLCR